jgi:hypothetical protein
MRAILFLSSVLALAAACDKGPKPGAASAASPAAAPSNAAAAAPAPGAATVAAPAPSAPVTGGQTFGAGVKLAETTAIATLLADPKAYAGKTVRAEGLIVDVCPKRGCWFEMAGAGPGEKLRFKVVDGEMVFPLDAKGKYAVAEGTLSVKDMTLEDSVAYAKYQAEEKGETFDPATVTAPISVVRIDGTGALIRDKM